jgi:hypothetical protein
MAMFYDQSQYLFVDYLDGSEVFIHYQDSLSKNATIGQIRDDLFLPIINSLVLDDIVNVLTENEVNGEILGLDTGYWRNINGNVKHLYDINDVSVTSISPGDMLGYDGSGWENIQNPILKKYYESEYNAGSLSSDYTIDLSNGNIQKMLATENINIYLPPLPPSGKFWSITLKLVGDGVHNPTFIGTDADIYWCSDITPINTGNSGSVCIYIFMTDVVSSKIYGTMSWREE